MRHTLDFQNIVPDKSISLFVKSISVFENNTPGIKTRLPFFADGFPGLIFQKCESGLIVNPHSKLMPEIFLYGQTICPVELEMSGKYSIVIFQLYPFVLKTFFRINPESINDDCYYLDDSEEDFSGIKHQLWSCKDLHETIGVISNLLFTCFERRKQKLDYEISQAIKSMILTNGQESIRSVVAKTNLAIRTFERRFKSETGLSPKQFAQIIQFQASLRQLTIKDYTSLSDIVYQNGFSDQSHFIKVFKAFTGKTPKTFNK